MCISLPDAHRNKSHFVTVKKSNLYEDSFFLKCYYMNVLWKPFYASPKLKTIGQPNYHAKKIISLKFWSPAISQEHLWTDFSSWQKVRNVQTPPVGHKQWDYCSTSCLDVQMNLGMSVSRIYTVFLLTSLRTPVFKWVNSNMKKVKAGQKEACNQLGGSRQHTPVVPDVWVKDHRLTDAWKKWLFRY